MSDMKKMKQIKKSTSKTIKKHISDSEKIFKNIRDEADTEHKKLKCDVDENIRSDVDNQVEKYNQILENKKELFEKNLLNQIDSINSKHSQITNNFKNETNESIKNTLSNILSILQISMTQVSSLVSDGIDEIKNTDVNSGNIKSNKTDKIYSKAYEGLNDIKNSYIKKVYEKLDTFKTTYDL